VIVYYCASHVIVYYCVSHVIVYYCASHVIYCVSHVIYCVSRDYMGVNGEALQLCAVYKKPYFLLRVMRDSVSVLQVTCSAFECAMKSKVCMIK